MEKQQMMSIDWHDFVVVETIEFTAEDDMLPLAPPIDFSRNRPMGAPPPLAMEEMAALQQAQMVGGDGECV
jgi:splicing factor 3A subunit 1